MRLAEGIRKHGFRKWYERQLLQSHAQLVLAFLSAIGVFAAIEAASRFKDLGEQLFDAGAVVLCTVIGIIAIRRYLFLLSHAEAVANQADCPACKTYGRLDAVDECNDGQRVHVRCRRCGHAWHIDA